MPTSTLVATPGDPVANAYCTLAFANQYMADRPIAETAWSSAGDDAKNAAILWATKLLDAHYEWAGWAASYTQALMWPRSGMAYRNHSMVPITVIPLDLQMATAEFARQLLDDDRAADNDIETLGLKSLKAGPVAMEFKPTVTAKVIPDSVFHLMPRSWGVPRSRTSMNVKLVRA